MNRIEKIQFLQDVKNGKRSIRELEPGTCFQLYDEKKDLFIDEKTGKIYTRTEVKQIIEKSAHRYLDVETGERDPKTGEWTHQINTYFCLGIDGSESCFPKKWNFDKL